MGEKCKSCTKNYVIVRQHGLENEADYYIIEVNGHLIEDDYGNVLSFGTTAKARKFAEELE